MVDPGTGRVTAYEEIWVEKELADPKFEGGALFVANKARTAWRARVGGWQMGLGRRDGAFWAWQAVWNFGEKWEERYSVGGDGADVVFLPKGGGLWREGECVQWEGDEWDVIESSDQ